MTLADDGAQRQAGHPGVAARGSVLADAPRDPASVLPTGTRQVAPVVLAAPGYTVLPRPADPPIIRDVTHIVLTVFSGPVTRFGDLDRCPCDKPVCRTTLVADPDDDGDQRILAMPAPDGTPIVRD